VALDTLQPKRMKGSLVTVEALNMHGGGSPGGGGGDFGDFSNVARSHTRKRVLQGKSALLKGAKPGTLTYEKTVGRTGCCGEEKVMKKKGGGTHESMVGVP